MRLFLLAMGAAVLLAGCGFEKPLTAWPSKNLNTWLLGVWEHRDDKGKVIGRARVVPKSVDTYWIVAERLAPRKSSATFEAWISRVGRSNFLTLRCLESSGEPAPGSHVFLHYQVLDQEHVRMRVPRLDAAAGASGYALRKEIRAKLTAGTLFPDPGTNWRRVSEVYWSGSDAPQPFQPLRFPLPRMAE